MSKLMIDTAIYLVRETHAKLGYTQSDEISLYFSLDLNKSPDAQYLYDGKFQKLTSVVASMATAYFNRELPHRIPEKASEMPVFDCRVWNVESPREGFLNFLWRQNDGVRNSVSTAAQARFPHRELQGKDGAAMREMLRGAGAPWEDEPQFFRTGTFVARTERAAELDAAVLARIPPDRRPPGPVVRSVTGELGIGLLEGPGRDAVLALVGCEPADAAGEPE